MRLLLRSRLRGGFTLIEMMIVVLVISILLTIAVPNWMRARESARTRSCVSNMTKIANAKEQLAMEYRMSTGDAVDWADIVPAYIKDEPQCPTGGVYSIEPIGTNPDCPIDGHDLPPVP
jgi:prepilin-type N-terminal cleavage/methylation domain-containing protein